MNDNLRILIVSEIKALFELKKTERLWHIPVLASLIEKLTDKVNKACFLTRWYYTRKLYKEIGKLDELVSSFYPSVPGTPQPSEELN